MAGNRIAILRLHTWKIRPVVPWGSHCFVQHGADFWFCLFLSSNYTDTNGGWEEGDSCQHASNRSRRQRLRTHLHLQGPQPSCPRWTTDISHNQCPAWVLRPLVQNNLYSSQRVWAISVQCLHWLSCPFESNMIIFASQRPPFSDVISPTSNCDRGGQGSFHLLCFS